MGRKLKEFLVGKHDVIRNLEPICVIRSLRIKTAGMFEGKKEHVNPSQPDDPYSSTDFYMIRWRSERDQIEIVYA